MSKKRDDESIHASELRVIILNELPELQVLLGDEARVEPHRLMRTLFEYATRAIEGREIPNVVRCFRLTKHLVDLSGECDSFARSALWTSYINRFRSDDPSAIEIFRQIDPNVRKALYSPVVFPHSWLREVQLALPYSDSWKTCLTVCEPVETEARRICQTSSVDHYAVVRLWLSPVLDDRSVWFRNGLDDSDDAPLVYLEAIIEGVRRGLAKRCDINQGVSYLRIDLTKLGHNVVDSRSEDFVTTAEQAVDRRLSENGVVEI